MNDDRFDDIIRSKLKNYKSNTQADWEFFKSRKILSDASYDASFDTELKDRLSNYEVEQTPLAWQDLYSKYKQQIYLRNQVIAIKSGELLILFLSLFTFFNYYDIDFFTDDIDQQIAEIEIHHEIINGVEDLVHSEFDLILSQAKKEKKNISHREYADLINLDGAGNSSLFSNPSELELKDIGLNNYFNNTLNDSKERNIDEGQVANRYGNSGLLQTESMTPLLPIQSLGLLIPVTHDQGFSLGISEPGTIPVNSIQENEDWFSISSMINNNTINSPRDEIYNLDEQVLYTPGFSVTTSYSKSFGAWEHQIGVSYSRISYAPYPVKETYQSEEGINVVSLNNIRYHMMSVPLHSQVHFIRNEDWSLFGGFGVQFGLVLHEFYDITDELDVPLPVSQARGSETEFRSRLSEKEFTRAVFNGGTFSDNIFMHAKFGVGVQRHLGDNMHLFLSAEYLHHLLSPLGPNSDKINVLSFGAGFKFRI